MAMTGAERHARWRKKHKEEIERLRTLANAPLANSEPKADPQADDAGPREENAQLRVALAQAKAENERLRGGLRKAGGAAAVLAENEKLRGEVERLKAVDDAEVARLEEICTKQSDEIDKAWERVNDLEDAMSEIEGLALDVDEAVESHEGVKDALVALAVHVITTMKPDDDSQKSIAALKAELPSD